MDDARRLLNEGDETTNIILADEQTAGRGRHNRPWITFEAPHGMAATFIVRGKTGPHLPLVVALALYEVLKPLVNSKDFAIKWPNDLLLNGKKAAGILCENMTENQGHEASLIGIGLNISPPEAIPESFQGTFLNADITPESLAKSIWACLNEQLTLYRNHGWTLAFQKQYVQHCATIGQHIIWQRGQPTELTGYARSLTKDGHLELVANDGTVHVIHSGEIFDKR